MAGHNPYITPVQAQAPKTKYRVTFLPMNTTFEVDPKKLPYGRTGEPGSLLDLALAAGISVDHACGGVCACATCHLIVREGIESCNEPTDDELDQLEDARGLTTESRLGCQCVPNGSRDVIVEVPAWNRNAVQEGH